MKRRCRRAAGRTGFWGITISRALPATCECGESAAGGHAAVDPARHADDLLWRRAWDRRGDDPGRTMQDHWEERTWTWTGPRSGTHAVSLGCHADRRLHRRGSLAPAESRLSLLQRRIPAQRSDFHSGLYRRYCRFGGNIPRCTPAHCGWGACSGLLVFERTADSERIPVCPNFGDPPQPLSAQALAT